MLDNPSEALRLVPIASSQGKGLLVSDSSVHSGWISRSFEPPRSFNGLGSSLEVSLRVSNLMNTFYFKYYKLPPLYPQKLVL